MPEPNWAEQVTAIATAVGALGLLGAIGAAVVAGRQVKEARKSRESQTASEFLRRWDEPALVETRQLVSEFATAEELSDDDRPPHHFVAEAGTIVCSEDLRRGDQCPRRGQTGEAPLKAPGVDIGDNPCVPRTRGRVGRLGTEGHVQSPLAPGRNSWAF
jgi:hypothetical protein